MRSDVPETVFGDMEMVIDGRLVLTISPARLCHRRSLIETPCGVGPPMLSVELIGWSTGRIELPLTRADTPPLYLLSYEPQKAKSPRLAGFGFVSELVGSSYMAARPQAVQIALGACRHMLRNFRNRRLDNITHGI